MSTASELAKDSSSIGPGSPMALRKLLYDALIDCRDRDCEHCNRLWNLIGEYDNARIAYAGPGHVVCAQHGVRKENHTCEWMVQLREICSEIEQGTPESYPNNVD